MVKEMLAKTTCFKSKGCCDEFVRQSMLRNRGVFANEHYSHRTRPYRRDVEFFASCFKRAVHNASHSEGNLAPRRDGTVKTTCLE